jgi:PAS domain S-box-containing protein
MLTESMLGDSTVRTQTAMEELIDELPLGVLSLDEEHAVGRCNPIALQLIESPVGAELLSTLKKMALRAATTGHLVEAVMSAGPLGELRILLARAEGVSGFSVYIERSATSRLRAEIQILRALLAAVTDGASPGEAIQPGLASLAGTLSSGWVALFESDADGKQLKCIAHVNVPPEHETYLLPHEASATASAVGRAAAVGAPVHLRLLARAPFPAERAMVGGHKFAGLALPVRSGEKTLGAIFVCGPVGILGEGEIRLVQGLADAVGALLQRSYRDESIKREREKRQTLMDNLPDAIVESGSTGEIELAAGRLQILGRAAEDLIGVAVEDLIAPADRAQFQERLRAADHEVAPIAETTVERPDGTKLSVEISLARASPASDRSVRAVFRDVTQRKKLEAEVAHAREVSVQRERMALLGQLAAAITHEINNPLAFVRSNVELLESLVPEHLKGSDDARTAMVKEALRDSLQGLDRVNAIITALKGMARRNQRESIEFDPETPIREAILIFERAKNGGGRIQLSLPALPLVMGSPGALSQVLLTLLDNALDALGGTSPPGLIEVTAREEAGGVALRVTDHGRGISDADRSQLFQAYFTTKELGKGTGLGLYLSRDILNATGGAIVLEERRDCTSFRVFLPLA